MEFELKISDNPFLEFLIAMAQKSDVVFLQIFFNIEFKIKNLIFLKLYFFLKIFYSLGYVIHNICFNRKVRFRFS